MPFHKKRMRLIVLSVILALCIVVALVGTFEKQIVNYLMPTKGWVQFDVPDNARPIRASVQKSPAGLNICNEEGVNWSEVTVKVTGIYNALYLAQPKPIKAGTCEYVSFSDFAEPSWKRMQMPPNENPIKVELLVNYSARGYVSLKPEQPK
jgi:hypothetical protein